MSVSLPDILAAAERLKGVATRTPLIESAALSTRLKARVLLKAENLQRGGSFKFRGAWNTLDSLEEKALACGVVAWSSGNHAQGVALAAKLKGVKATIVMPKDTPDVKIAGTRQFGADIVFYDRYTEDREAIARAIADERGCEIVPSYDRLEVIAGQGTAGLEIVQQCQSFGVRPDRLLVCCGGGGLCAGVAIAVHATWPECRIHTVEPLRFDDMRRSLASGERQGNSPDARSVCDALLTPMPGNLTFPVLKEHVSEGLAVDDQAALAAVTYAARELKLVVEPGGAVALAALLQELVDVRGETVVALLSGGNIDPALLAKCVAAEN